MVVKTNNAVNNFNATQSHLETIKRRLVDLLGDDYAILDEPEEFDLEGETFIRYPNRCIHYTHNKKHYDQNPSGWVAVSQKDGRLISGCWVCKRPQVIKRSDDYQPAPTLLTLSCNDPHLLKVLVAFGCKEVEEVNGRDQIAVAFPVTYADGSEGFHYRVALEGKNKWRHIEGRKAGEAVFALHRQGIQSGIQKKRFVIITESPLDAAVLNAAGFPAIAVLGKGNADALACDLHRETLLNLLGDAGDIYVWVEPDAAEFPLKVANALQRSVKVIYPPVPEEEEDDLKAYKDAKRLWVNKCGKDWDKFKAEISGLLQKATEVVAPQPEPVQATEPEPEVVKHNVKVTIPESAFKRLGEIVMQEVDWLVGDYIPIGAVTLLAGEGGAGKSTLLCDLAASILKGDKWLSKFEVSQGGVILIVTEGITEIRSRLEGYGITNDDPLIIVDLTAWDDYSPLKAAQALPAILQIAKERLGDIPIRLIGLDCLRGFGFDEKQASRQKGDRLPIVREIYTPLANFAQQEGAAVVVTHHFRKLLPEERRRLYPKRKKGKEVAPNIDINLLRNLIAGTADIVNAARQALVVVSNEETGTATIVPVKSNRSQILGAPIHYDWRADAPTFLNFLDEDETLIERAIALLRRELADGAKPSDELKEIARKEGISERTLKRAKSRLGVDHKLRVVNGEKVWFWFFPNKPDPQDNPPTKETDRPEGDPQGSPPEDPQRETDPQGNPPAPTQPVSDPHGSVPNPSDNPKLGTVGTVSEKAQQNLGFLSVPNETGLWHGWHGWQRPDDGKVCQVCQTQNYWHTTLAHLESPINKGISGKVCQVCQTFGIVEDQPEGDPQAAPPDLFADFFDTGLLPDLIVEDSPTEPNQPEGDQPCAEAQSEVSPPDLPANKPEEIPPAQPFATLTEPVCPVCGERLDPEPDSGLAACLGCGRLFKVEIPPVSPDDDGDDNPPDPHNNGHSGGQSGFAPPEIEFIRINSIPTQPENQNRMTERLPDGSVKLEWERKSETVAPDDLNDWKPIETIPEISLPNIESVEIPPTIVLDLETTDLDPAKGRILAAGLALYLNGKEVETLIIANKGNEADLLAQTFDYLRETCNKLGNVILTGYNIADFDLPYLIERAHKLKVGCPFRYLKDSETGEIKRWKVAATEGTLKSDPLDYPAVVTDLPIKVIDTLHLVCRWDYTAKALRNYDLKSVAAYFNVNQPDRPILSPDQILNSFQHDRKTFEAYLMADLRETYALFETHIKPYAGVAALTKLPLDQVATRSTAWVWQQILERHYKEIPQPDEKRKYEGGLVVSRKGLWFPCLKVDIASLYPTIMLAYRIHSRKDTDQIALHWLKTLTRQRLELKAKAKAGDANAQILQEAMKILLNSLYGFYGTGGYPFNDMGAAAKVTEVGRKILTCMIAAIEEAGGIVVEADTDGIIVCYRNADPQQILEAVNAAIPEVFKVEDEWREATVFVSDDKNYIVIDRNGDPIAVKGSKWRGRDKEAYLTQAIPTFVRIWATEGKEAALNYALRVLGEIRNGQGWNWVVRTHRVGKGDKFLIDAGFKVGEIATYAYKVKTNKRKEIAKSPEEGYDCDYYAKQFSDLVKEVIAAIDPAQIEAWREIVNQEARPLIFATT
jgi:DNA polymerase elongation subunit (family B)